MIAGWLRARVPALALALGSVACAAPISTPRLTAAERWNAEGVRRLDQGDSVAEECFLSALREAELIDDLRSQAEAWDNLGALSTAQGRASDAQRAHRKALDLYRARGVRDLGEVRARANLGAALLALGELGDAEAEFAAATKLASWLRKPTAAHLARAGLASIALRRGAAPRAAALARALVEEARAAADDAGLGAALAIEGVARLSMGELGLARVRLEEALAVDQRRAAPFAIAEDLRALAEVAARAGDQAAASSYLARRDLIVRALGSSARGSPLEEARKPRERDRQGDAAKADPEVR